MRDPHSCSALSAALDEPMGGTAPYAVGWLAVEQPGPWGRKALTDSRLDVDLGVRLDRACAAVGVRPALVRRPGRDPLPTPPGRTVLAAHTTPGDSWLYSARVEDVGALEWEALAAAVAAGDADAVRRLLPGASPSPPHLLVCSNGRRDVCCALQGRPVALAAAVAAPDRVWEATHLGGHRFAPTAAVLPTGMVHGRLDAEAAVAVLDAADRGEVVVESARGRTTWSAPGQAAELAVRRATGEQSADALRITEDDAGWLVTHADGRAWRVGVAEQTARTSRPESCGKDAAPLRSWVADEPKPLP